MHNKALAVANYFIDLANSGNRKISMSNLKLQKLLFYAQGFNKVFNEDNLFNEEIYGWTYGPVVPSVYDKFRNYYSANIPQDHPFKETNITLTTEEKNVIKWVYDQLGHLDAWTLVEMSHEDTSPWEKYYDNGRAMDVDEIASYCESKLLRK